MDAFVYGTLCNPQRAREILGYADFGPDARLVGLHRVEGQYPTLAPGGETEGRILRLDDGDIGRLDDYEGVERGLYRRVRVPAGDRYVWVYVGRPDALGVDLEWPGSGPFVERVEQYIETRDVAIER